MEVYGIAQDKWPQGKVDCRGPASMSMQELLMHALREVGNGSLSNAILEVCIYATKAELLPCIMACLLEGVVVEPPIVTVVW